MSQGGQLSAQTLDGAQSWAVCSVSFTQHSLTSPPSPALAGDWGEGLVPSGEPGRGKCLRMVCDRGPEREPRSPVVVLKKGSATADLKG